MQAAELLDRLRGSGPFTVFVPTDDAFAKLPKGTVRRWFEQIPTLRHILLSHVVSGRHTMSALLKLQALNTLADELLLIAVDGSSVKVNESRVTACDIEASNGLVHVIDQVLVDAEKSPAH
jgi:uncharacterized surface protein with fasciclin (FAS1) repeats